MCLCQIVSVCVCVCVRRKDINVNECLNLSSPAPLRKTSLLVLLLGPCAPERVNLWFLRPVYTPSGTCVCVCIFS